MVYPPQGFPTAVSAAAPSKPLEATVFVAASDARPEVKALADFVCTGSGDQNTIAQAINSLPSAGGKVKLSEGTFVFNGTLTILKSNITLEGSGPGTVIFLADGSNCDIIRVGNGSTALSKIKICNLSIDGNKENQTNWPSFGIYFYGGSGYLITNSMIENVWVTNSYGYGIYLYYSNNNIIKDNLVQSIGDFGIVIENSNNNTVVGNVCQSNYGSGIAVYSSNGVTVVGNVCQSNDYYGIASCYSICSIIGNICEFNSSYGILLFYANNCVVMGNILKDNSQDIYIWVSNYNIISNNICIATANKTTYAVNEDGSDYNIVTSNYCSGQVTGKIKLVGLNSIAANNIEA